MIIGSDNYYYPTAFFVVAAPGVVRFEYYPTQS